MLRDFEAVPYLIDILRSKYTAAYKEAEEALEKICKQNFEDKARKWAGWHEKFASKPWIEWLIEGLKHKEPVIRQSAYNDLQEETKMVIEFHPTADKSKRESQLMLWEKWWETEGKVKFG